MRRTVVERWGLAACVGVVGLVVVVVPQTAAAKAELQRNERMTNIVAPPCRLFKFLSHVLQPSLGGAKGTNSRMMTRTPRMTRMPLRNSSKTPDLS